MLLVSSIVVLSALAQPESTKKPASSPTWFFFNDVQPGFDKSTTSPVKEYLITYSIPIKKRMSSHYDEKDLEFDEHAENIGFKVKSWADVGKKKRSDVHYSIDKLSMKTDRPDLKLSSLYDRHFGALRFPAGDNAEQVLAVDTSIFATVIDTADDDSRKLLLKELSIYAELEAATIAMSAGEAPFDPDIIDAWGSASLKISNSYLTAEKYGAAKRHTFDVFTYDPSISDKEKSIRHNYTVRYLTELMWEFDPTQAETLASPTSPATGRLTGGDWVFWCERREEDGSVSKGPVKHIKLPVFQRIGLEIPIAHQKAAENTDGQ